MSAFSIVRTLRGEPSLLWITIPEGLRKEEIADILGDALSWSKETRNDWIEKDTVRDPDHTEGVYFPDTYLIPRDESPGEVAQRMIRRFDDQFAPYATAALEQNIRWPTVIRIASLVQREAAGARDMPLIAGVIWNRLDIGMPLQIDATLQYIRGDQGEGWWAPITPEEKKLDSPYNTYRHTGLPPGPIANPGLDAIRAVLQPEETECLYYLHDATGEIHCSPTYEGHKQNIEDFLR
jgi:UPF0755 protein